jgi:hypothetical protein
VTIVLLGVAQSSALGAYSWSGVLPITGNGTTMTLSAAVQWGANDGPLTMGTIRYQLTNQGSWTGTATINYTYNYGNLAGTFTNASITFNPPLPSGTSVQIIYTASGSNGMQYYQSSTAATVTVP